MKQPIKVALVGNPNVGKSSLFNQITKRYVSVSNYPGTTVSVTRGKITIQDKTFEVMDTPGMYSFLPVTEEERVTRKIILEESPDIIVHVVDSKNLERMLPLTLQLMETDFKVILNLNIMDEAEKIGMIIDTSFLETYLDIPVIPTISIKNKGVQALKDKFYELSC